MYINDQMNIHNIKQRKLKEFGAPVSKGDHFFNERIEKN